MAAHLDVTRQYVAKLADTEGVLRREPDGGFLLDANRVAYLRFLRRERKASPQGAADVEFTASKTKLVQLRIAEKEKVLMRTEEAMDLCERLVGMFRTGLHSLPARIGGRDLVERRRIDGFCNDILREILGNRKNLASPRCCSEHNPWPHLLGLFERRANVDRYQSSRSNCSQSKMVLAGG